MRSPVVAGQFYPADAEVLRRQLDGLFRDLGADQGPGPGQGPALGAVVPHAGYAYSGSVAAAVFARLPLRETYVLIGPSHTGMGMPVAVSRDSWKTPLGVVEVDLELVDALSGSIVVHDEAAHRYEHSLEVQIPFLQQKFASFKILPICLGLQDEETAVEVGVALGEAVRGLGRSCTVIASSDFTHYEPQEVARKKDASVMEAALRMDVPEVYRRVYGQDVTACGYGPIAATIVASRIMGAKSGKLIRYATSGDVTGDYSQVVGYGGMVFL